MIRLPGTPSRSEESSIASPRLGREPVMEVVTGALIPACVRGDFPDPEAQIGAPPARWKGGVYDRQSQVCRASLVDRDGIKVVLAYGPAEIAATQPLGHYSEAVYGGLIFKHYGHFLLESTSRLWWPLLNDFKGKIIFQCLGPLPEFITRFFELLGISEQIVIAGGPLRVDSLFVPHRAFSIRNFAHEYFRTPFLRAGAAVDKYGPNIDGLIREDSAGVFLSRKSLRVRKSLGEDRIEDIFLKNRFDVVAPEALKLDLQIALIRNNRTFAGILGSAFHNILFSETPVATICICRDGAVNPNYLLIDALMNNHATYINGLADGLLPTAFEHEVRLDVERISSRLSEMGLALD